jgi:hypothetical protein
VHRALDPTWAVKIVDRDAPQRHVRPAAFEHRIITGAGQKAATTARTALGVQLDPHLRPAEKRPRLPRPIGVGGLPATRAGVARLIALSCSFGPSLPPPLRGDLHYYGLC